MNEKGPRRFLSSDTRSPVGRTVWQGLGDVVEEECHSGAGFEVSKV